MAAQVLKAHGLEFASRTNNEFFRIVSHAWNDLILAPVGDKWKIMRRICSTHLFNNSMLKASSGFRESEMKHTVKSIIQQSGATIKLQEHSTPGSLWSLQETQLRAHASPEALAGRSIDKHRRRKDQAGEGFVPRDFTDVLISLEDKDKLPDISILALLSVASRSWS
ncbi:flavonoid 3'-monooxygenase [Selaginella moellendorffii]|uniref:flavonoid 3'-monooxygenase n=1 Tax=Selaginella moellendorffii TaxID=88036 RepID=UPI000D1C83CD|nr:flavonoid 3'-monooxygenase [Selaginella moellendorffii]|eukprot:XP_024519808.1 flavonoid 3'-monooxygenase [Selaginella moellendorffii]